MSTSRKPTRSRRYLAIVAATALAAGTLPLPIARAAVPFGSDPLAGDRVIALAQPLSDGRWNLIVLEQREPAPPCWRRNTNGTVLTYEMHLPESTCGRYLSSSAYSLRVAGEDLRQPWRLRVDETKGQLHLLASGNRQAEPLVIGRGRAAGSSLVELSLENDWTFERRNFNGQSLSHLYVAHADPLPVLLAQARNGGSPLLARLPAPPPPLAPEPRPVAIAAARRTPAATPVGSDSSRTRTAAGGTTPAASPPQPATGGSSSRLARLERLRLGGPRAAGPDQIGNGETGSGVVALQVVPFQP